MYLRINSIDHVKYVIKLDNVNYIRELESYGDQAIVEIGFSGGAVKTYKSIDEMIKLLSECVKVEKGV